MMMGERELVGDIEATQGPTPCRVLLDLPESQRSFGRCNPILISATPETSARLLLRAENRRRSIQGAPLFPTPMETALKRFPICVRHPSLADGAPEALFPGGYSMTSGASDPPAAGGRPASAGRGRLLPLAPFSKHRASTSRASPKAPRGAAKRECPSSRNLVLLRSARSRSMHEEQSRTAVASERQSICRHPRGPEFRAARWQQDQPRRGRRTGDRPSEISRCH